MSQQNIKVRTPGSHIHHGRIKNCGCATRQNADETTPLMRCVCGALYLKDIVGTVADFVCYDCKRLTHVMEELRGLPLY